MNREKEIDKEIEALREEKQELKSRRKVKCLHCKKHTPLKNALVVRTHWYTSPHGCTGGDYWNFGEYQFFCTKCEEFSRAYIGSWEKHWRSGKVKPEALKDPRVKLFNFIKKHSEFVGEFLDSYDGQDNNMTIEDLRTRKREREEKENACIY